MKRNSVTEQYYSDKMTVDDFIKEITSESHNKAFMDNMNHLGLEPRYPEEWIKIYAAWSEMN